jgi:diaminopimelate decarboxylase
MYDSHHDVEIYRKNGTPSLKEETVRIVGNICETGDIIAKDRTLPESLRRIFWVFSTAEPMAIP